MKKGHQCAQIKDKKNELEKLYNEKIKEFSEKQKEYQETIKRIKNEEDEVVNEFKKYEKEINEKINDLKKLISKTETKLKEFNSQLNSSKSLKLLDQKNKNLSCIDTSQNGFFFLILIK
jgi:uncharacterized coiled-coil DUF342 family protein